MVSSDTLGESVMTWIEPLAEHDRGIATADDLAHLLYARAQFIECLRRTDEMIARQLMRRIEARLHGDGAVAAD
jgi:hypothetical protein